MMKTIDINELKEMYDEQVEDAKMKTYEMINSKDYINTPFEDALGIGINWGYSQQKQFDRFDDFVESANNLDEQEDVLIRHHTNDTDMLTIAQQDFKQFKGKRTKNKNKRQREIRKIMRDDAMKELVVYYPFNDLKDAEMVKQIWLDCKIQIRNDITTLMENIGILREVEKYIRLSNSYNMNK